MFSEGHTVEWGLTVQTFYSITQESGTLKANLGYTLPYLPYPILPEPSVRSSYQLRGG